MPKKNKAEEFRKNNAPLNSALKFFVGGCIAEIYLLAVRKYYINGDINQMLGWDAMIPTLIYVGLAVLAVGVILAAVWRKETGWKRSTAWTVVFSGVFFSAGNWLIKMVYPTGTSILSVLTAVAMLLGVLWCFYARECFYAMMILSSGVLTSWVCRHGLENMFWKTYVLVGACVYLVLLAAVAITARKVEKADGMFGNVQLLPADTDCTVLFATCGLSAAATVLSLFSATIAYYALWTLGIVIFSLAVYYTVKEL